MSNIKKQFQQFNQKKIVLIKDLILLIKTQIALKVILMEKILLWYIIFYHF